MKIKFTLSRAGGTAADLVAQVDGRATIGDLADYLAAADPNGADSERQFTLRRASDNFTYDPAALVGESPLASGAVLALTPASTRYLDASPETGAATLEVRVGPDAGKKFALASGANVVGRDDECAVVLSDPLVSRKHVRINVTDVVEVIDLGSANGVLVGGGPVSRAVLSSGQVVSIGDTDFVVQMHLQATAPTDGHVDFVRPPAVRDIYVGREFEGITAPERPKPQRFPTIALIAPLLMGGVLYLVTQRVASLIFVALSPLMLIGSALESRIAGKREFKKAIEIYRAELAALKADILLEQAVERSVRLMERPSTEELATAVREHDAWLWTRRRDADGFAQLRLGLGIRPSRCTVKPPMRNKAPYELVAEQEQVLASVAAVAGLPVVADLAAGALGIGGSREAALDVARALVLQTLALHSPAEVGLAAVLDPASVGDWDWLKWTPHASAAQSPLTARPLASTPAGAVALVADLETLIEQRTGEKASEPAILVLIESGAPVEHNRLVALAERGPALGIFVCWIAPSASLLPAAAKTFVDVRRGDQPAAGYVTERETVTPVQFETLAASAAAETARLLAPITDAGARADDDSDLPRSVSQLALLGPQLAEDGRGVLERWLENGSVLSGPYAPSVLPKKAGNLRAVIGQTAVGPHVLDLRIDGPHALVGGTTGAGKSELLQSWITSMAATSSPERVTFLLVDYKGGSAFADCVQLPHTIGLVTDLSPRLVRRALTSLSAELRYREELLAEHNAKDLVELEKHGIAGAPPSLVIVVDEFAALVKEVPEFVDGVVNVAQRGRSLGLHLVLATQRPAGAINDNLRANTNLRISLRMAVEADSQDVLGTDDAAFFPTDIPGRAMSKSGASRLAPFQTAYAGGWTSSTPEAPEVVVEDLTLGTAKRWSPRHEAPPVARDRNRTDIKRLVAATQAAHQLGGLREPRKAWLPELAPIYDIARLPTRRRDDELTFAIADDPERQAQPPVSFRPDRDSNLVVYGTSGSGKSTLLRGLAVAAGFASRGGPTQVYGIDFGARGLAMLEDLPHVGSIIPGGDDERIGRLLGWLRQVIDERAGRYSAVNAATVTDYRSLASDPSEARILLLIDGVASMRAAYEASSNARFIELLTSIASDGRPVGVHVVLSSDQRNGLHTPLASAVPRRVVMRMASTDDYSMLGVPTDVLDADANPGRAFDEGREIQVAVLGERADVVSQAAEVAALARALREIGIPDAPAIRSLGTEIPFESLRPSPSRVPIGIAAETLTDVGIEPVGSFLLTGPPASGRTTALRTLVAGLRASQPSAEFHYFGQRRSELTSLPVWTSSAFTPDEIAAVANALAARVQSGVSHKVVVIVEGAGEMTMGPADAPLAALLRACSSEGHFFVAEGEVSTLRATSGYLGAVKGGRRGLALQPDPETGSGLFNTGFGRFNRADFPAGRGFLVGSGRASVVQVALPPEGS